MPAEQQQHGLHGLQEMVQSVHMNDVFELCLLTAKYTVSQPGLQVFESLLF